VIVPLDLPDGTLCFIDSNILYYALVRTQSLSDPCLQLLDRVIAGRISAHVTISVLSDAVHKVMTSEAAQIGGRERAGIVGFLKKHPELVTRLTEYPQVMERLAAVPLNVLSLDESLLRDAVRIAVSHGLLTNDALIVAVMQRHQLTHLVTNDDDFNRVAGVTVWMPR
jgi:predicted nucleic acid-binding protein